MARADRNGARALHDDCGAHTADTRYSNPSCTLAGTAPAPDVHAATASGAFCRQGPNNEGLGVPPLPRVLGVPSLTRAMVQSVRCCARLPPKVWTWLPRTCPPCRMPLPDGCATFFPWLLSRHTRLPAAIRSLVLLSLSACIADECLRREDLAWERLRRGATVVTNAGAMRAITGRGRYRTRLRRRGEPGQVCPRVTAGLATLSGSRPGSPLPRRARCSATDCVSSTCGVRIFGRADSAKRAIVAAQGFSCRHEH